MTVAAVSHVASHGAASTVVPQGKSDQEMQILLLLVFCGAIIFIQHDKDGKPQDGAQYAALGVVGFLLLFLAQFWPELALTFTILFVVAVVLNSPNGVPLISSSTAATTANTTPTLTGGGAVVVNPNTGTASVAGDPNKAS